MDLLCIKHGKWRMMRTIMRMMMILRTTTLYYCYCYISSTTATTTHLPNPFKLRPSLFYTHRSGSSVVNLPLYTIDYHGMVPFQKFYFPHAHAAPHMHSSYSSSIMHSHYSQSIKSTVWHFIVITWKTPLQPYNIRCLPNDRCRSYLLYHCEMRDNQLLLPASYTIIY